MIEIVYKENKEQANGNEGYFHLPKNIRQVGDTNGRERIYLEDYVGTFLKKYFSNLCVLKVLFVLVRLWFP